MTAAEPTDASPLRPGLREGRGPLVAPAALPRLPGLLHLVRARVPTARLPRPGAGTARQGRAREPEVNCANCGLPCPRARARGGLLLQRLLPGAPLARQRPRRLARSAAGARRAERLPGHGRDGLLALALRRAARPRRPGAGEGAAALRGLLRLGAMAFAVPIFALLGLPLWDAVVTLRRWLSSETLVLAGSSAARLASVWNTVRGGGDVWFDTATMVLLLFSLGRWLEVRARERARGELGALAVERERARGARRHGGRRKRARGAARTRRPRARAARRMRARGRPRARGAQLRRHLGVDRRGAALQRRPGRARAGRQPAAWTAAWWSRPSPSGASACATRWRGCWRRPWHPARRRCAWPIAWPRRSCRS